MDEGTWLAQQFENNRGHLRGVAYRMLGSVAEADAARVRTAQSEPSLLHRIIRFRYRPQHPVRHSAQMPAVIFELLR